MNASRHVRTAGALGHLLLVVVLALGVFVMHALGHPHDSSGTGMSGPVHASAPMHSAPAAQDHPADTAASTHADQMTNVHDSRSADPPVPAMDMLSLCVAVMLGAWVLAGLLRSALSRRPDRLSPFLTRACVVLRPNPPPRGPDLTQLSVLRL